MRRNGKEVIAETAKVETRESSRFARCESQLHRGDKSVTSRCNLEIFLRRFDLPGKREPWIV